jgi:hypothetical protein
MLKNKLRVIVLISVAVLLFLSVTVFSGCGKVAEYADPITENILLGMNNADYATFSRDFDSSLKAELSEDTFPDFLAAVNGSIGDYITGSKKINGFDISNGITTATYKADFEGFEGVTVDVIMQKIDGQMKVIGLWFK